MHDVKNSLTVLDIYSTKVLGSHRFNLTKERYPKAKLFYLTSRRLLQFLTKRSEKRVALKNRIIHLISMLRLEEEEQR